MILKKTALALGLLLSSGLANASLGDWQTEGTGEWTYDESTGSWFQSVNTANFTFLYDPSNTSLGNAISGSIEVGNSVDDDLIGFALGYSAGDYENPLADYWLVTWKRGTQSGWTAGLSLWHVTGAITSDPWSSSGDKLTKIQSGKNYGSTGWSKNTQYGFDITYKDNTLAVFIDEELELAVSSKDAGVDSFQDGGFAYFNFSQDKVYYHQVQYDLIDEIIDEGQKDAIVSAVPVQGAAAAGLALFGLAGLSKRRKK